MQATLYNQAGAEVGTVDLDEYIFGDAARKQHPPPSDGARE